MANLAVKYRPKTWDDVSEQEVITDMLQSMCEADTLECRNFLLIGPAGTGKAQPLYSKVLTKDGFVSMGDITPGTIVYTRYGELAEVSQVFPQGKMSVFEILLEDGKSFRVANNHLNIVHVHENDSFIEYVIPTHSLLDLMKKGHDIYIMCMDEIIYDKEYSNDRTIECISKYVQIGSISYIGVEECKCIFVEHPDHSYITDGFVPTHNTTLGRIMSNVLNEGVGEPIEIDAASNGNVESIRSIVEQAKQYPVGQNYKIFLIDECFSGDIKVLTDQGYKCFKDLLGDEKIAQYTDEGNIEFVRPLRWIKKLYSGEMIRFKPKHSTEGVLMTPNHVQPFFNLKSGKIREQYAKDFDIKKHHKVVLSGNGTGYNAPLTDLDRIAIASIADGYRCPDSTAKGRRWQIRLSKVNKIDRLMHLFESCHIDWVEWKCEEGIREFGYYLPDSITKYFKDIFSFDVGKQRAIEIIDEVMNWDGSYKSGYPMYFSSVLKDNAEFVSIVATLAGYSTHTKVHTYNCITHNTEYQVCIIPGYVNMRFKPHYFTEYFEGMVYCVEVPSNKIVVQTPDGFTFISGNCHAISNTGWQAALKVLEENPAKSVFVLCIAEGSLVYTPEGPKPIESIEVEDTVWNGCEYAKVSNKFYNGIKQCNRIKLADGTSIICTPNHKIYALLDDKEDWIPAGELRIGDNIFVYSDDYSDIAYSNLINERVGYFCTVESIQDVGYKHVYDLEIPEGHNFICNGIKVHNCTTNPEKIPATILSRVQTFQLSKISLKGIHDRLIKVIESENAEGRNITYTDDAVTYIAKLANGGMRDSLTLLDKALAYSENLSADTLAKGLNLPKYDDYFNLLTAYAKKDNTSIATVIDNVYNSGVNFVKWFEGFHSFVMNIVKYIFLQDINLTMIPSTYAEKISKYNSAHVVICLGLANKLVKLNSELKYTQYLQEIALTYLCFKPTGK